MIVYIIWQYQPRKGQIWIINSQCQKFQILVTIILFLIYLNQINLHKKPILRDKIRITLHLRIDINKF